MANYPKVPMPCYVFDIDGTIADLTHRRHHVENKPKNWQAFHAGCVDDAPIEHVCDLARRLYWHARELAAAQNLMDLPWDIILMSGRNEAYRMATMEWLHKVARLPIMNLYMRADGDFRDDTIIKRELLKKARDDGYVPIMAFDDRDRVVKMWRESGIPCAQVAPGDF